MLRVADKTIMLSVVVLNVVAPLLPLAIWKNKLGRLLFAGVLICVLMLIANHYRLLHQPQVCSQILELAVIFLKGQRLWPIIPRKKNYKIVYLLFLFYEKKGLSLKNDQQHNGGVLTIKSQLNEITSNSCFSVS
jgi:hypothetical protein